MKYIPFILALSIIFLTNCGGVNEQIRTSATGTIYECLVVTPSTPLSQQSLQKIAESGIQQPTGNAYSTPITTPYELVAHTMGADMPCLPQMEPYFNLTQVSMTAFDNYLKPTRNILLIDINPNKYTQTKAKVSTDVWSTPQAVYRIQAPSEEEFVNYWLQHANYVRDWFVRQELKRQTQFYLASTNKPVRTILQKKYGCDMLIPEDYMLIMDTTLSTTQTTLLQDSIQVLWCCNNKGSLRRDIVVYSYPYTDQNTFTLDNLNAKRDEILSQIITASIPGSYMGTEYRIFPPQLQNVQSLYNRQKDFYATEVRGLWKIYKGEAMGGPYVSLTRLDQVRGRIITAETFLFAAGQKKRNPLRQAEAILYTLKLPTDTIGQI